MELKLITRICRSDFLYGQDKWEDTIISGSDFSKVDVELKFKITNSKGHNEYAILSFDGIEEGMSFMDIREEVNGIVNDVMEKTKSSREYKLSIKLDEL